MRRILSFLLLIATCLTIKANDAVFMVNGNQLTPLQETDVAIVKEVLTITICDDDTARVDVIYELDNRGEAKQVNVGFVADAPYNVYDGVFNALHHPFISAFTVMMNEGSLPVECFVIGKKEGKADYTPLDMSQWMGYTEQQKAGKEYVGSEILYSTEGDSAIGYAYVYNFKAQFNKGINRIHHTYKYVVSSSVASVYDIPYTLTPAMRWANHQIDDFTLRIRVENTAKHFVIDRGAFPDGEFVVENGFGKHRTIAKPYEEGETMEEVALRNGSITWHSKDYRTDKELAIHSADYILFSHTDNADLLGFTYDRTATERLDLVPYGEKPKTNGLSAKRIKRNLPYANRGYVFRDKKLNAYFRRLFWYMPDASWKPSTDDFTKGEWELINGK